MGKAGAPEAGLGRFVPFALATQSVCALSTGKGDPELLVERALASARELGALEAERFALLHRGAIALLSGRFADASDSLEEAVRLIPGSDAQMHLGYRVVAAVLNGDADRAEAATREPPARP